MGIVIPGPGHARRFSTKPKMDGSGNFFRRFNSSEKIKKCRGGIEPQTFQLETAVTPTPVSFATAAWPPRASIMASTEVSIPPYNPIPLDLSRVHITEIYPPQNSIFNEDMGQDTWDKVAYRLRLLEAVAGVPDRQSHQRFLDELEIDNRVWSNWVNEGTFIRREAAVAIKMRYGFTLDWIYAGDMQSLPPDLRIQVHHAEKHDRAVPIRKRGRPPKTPAQVPSRKAAR